MVVYYLHTLKLTPVPTSEQQQEDFLPFLPLPSGPPPFCFPHLSPSLPVNTHSLCTHSISHQVASY